MRVLHQFVDDQVGRALSRASDETRRWERAIDRIEFARCFMCGALPLLSHIRDPRDYSRTVWNIHCSREAKEADGTLTTSRAQRDAGRIHAD